MIWVRLCARAAGRGAAAGRRRRRVRREASMQTRWQRTHRRKLRELMPRRHCAKCTRLPAELL
eukprot:6194239-Pleurochrysis_carterae.AAC.2